MIVRALRVILPEVSGMTRTLSTCTHPGASLSYEVTGSPYPSLIFSPMNLRIHHASSGALDFGSVHAPYRSEKGKSSTWDYPTLKLAQFRLADRHCSSTNIVGASPTLSLPSSNFRPRPRWSFRLADATTNRFRFGNLLRVCEPTDSWRRAYLRNPYSPNQRETGDDAQHHIGSATARSLYIFISSQGPRPTTKPTPKNEDVQTSG